ncbi:MarR family winged helix-turn-helix transcriptional regulator [Nonomuraea zeae]|uniref:MarR family transcriptional regulator n=1 Tax=Nonomuraea zeae TaxID=1642303 RepID=A0A5S4HHW8_9ACTN|nr:MarR family transcriptional regulator [Nonomuraea zeae]TMR38590.1 MarR family transcriptional regulator [Nonomuraea zeae]
MSGTTARPGYLIKRAQIVLHEAMVTALAPHGLTVPQYAVLTALGEEPGLSNAELARRAFVTPQSMNVVLRELEERKLLSRRPHPQHRKVLQAELTAGGRDLLDAAGAAVDGVESRMLAGLAPQARARLAGALAACIDALAADGRR